MAPILMLDRRTGRDCGYAALADYAGGTKNKRLLAVSDKRLLVGIRNGKAKVVGVLVDASDRKGLRGGSGPKVQENHPMSQRYRRELRWRVVARRRVTDLRLPEENLDRIMVLAGRVEG